MGSVSIWHLLVLLVPLGLLVISALLPVLIKPSGPNRFGPSVPAQSLPRATMAGFRKYFHFEGRASRSEYWWFFPAALLTWYLLTILSGSLQYFVPGFANIWLALTILLLMFLIVPMLAAAVRRLHDINSSGWWLLLRVFGAGCITLIVLLAWPSTPDEPAEVF